MWHKAESNTRPDTVDTQSSKKYVFVRKNITEKQKEEENETRTIYVYDEYKIPKELYPLFEQQQADIDYLTMIVEE